MGVHLVNKSGGSVWQSCLVATLAASMAIGPIGSADAKRAIRQRPVAAHPPLREPAAPPQTAGLPAVPVMAREFRGVWVASVRNIDWPSKPGLPVAQQQAELIALLDRAVSLRLNAVILQIRPACDALYASPLEPWSEYLTGQMGKAPEPYYDPLDFAVVAAHARGLELHAWFNPYRARLIDDNQGPAAPEHISVTHPEWVKRYGRFLWLDPGEPAVQDHSTAVIMDVVRRYDIDAVHMDDYFYPYREPLRDANGKALLDEQGQSRFQPFPDDGSYRKYQAGGGKLGRDDWRRDNVNHFIERLYAAIKAEKPAVKLGISPFGIWKPGYPAQIKGMNQYDMIYADARLWFMRGWLDYFAPQLYWSIEGPDQSYPVLLRWWAEQNTKARHLWPGLFTSRVRDTGESSFVPRQISYQIQWSRLQSGASGHIHFSMKPLLENSQGVADLLAAKVYADPALVPASPWLDDTLPGRPRVALTKNILSDMLEITWQPAQDESAWLWTLYIKRKGQWSGQILPADRRHFAVPYAGADAVESVEIAAVGHQGQEGPRVTMVIGKAPARDGGIQDKAGRARPTPAGM